MARIAVITGGSTPERHVALAGAAQVVDALRARGYAVAVVDTCSGVLSKNEEERLLGSSVGSAPPTPGELRELGKREMLTRLIEIDEVQNSDALFLVLHGRQGEGGEFQALLELAGLEFVGSGSLGSALAMDKDISKRLFRDAQIPTAEWVKWPADNAEISSLGYPLVVKPSKVGSTVGLTVVESPEEVERAVREALQFDDEVILERFTDGREFTVGILGEKALAVGEIIPRHTIFDYECKYTPGMAEEVFPARISEALTRRLQSLALQVHRVLKLRDFSRVDFRANQGGSPYCLEANTLPGLTSTSLLPQSAAAVGIDFGELCHRLCQLALDRKSLG
ncbi:MAG: D-alanine--D-alanine ligase [Proteobacteria bacterium]|nr:D-alanine--D-alanine ligase [Pseudomonadota bacterium]NIS68492.1 D-alanine--D-alanine ligase [Pseudomonadota bacterium]